MYQKAVDCEGLTRTAHNKRIFILRINLSYSGTILPFNFQKSQFQIISAFSMTINKFQGKTFKKAGILLRQTVFTVSCTSQQVDFDY